MMLYHRTTRAAADAILRDGFIDGTGNYLTANKYSGVWLSDRPLDVNEGAHGDVLLSVDLAETMVAPYEWIEEGKPFREFLVPADVVNRGRRAEVTD